MTLMLLLLLAAEEPNAERTLRAVAESGRATEIAEPLSDRVGPPLALAPGAPPMLSFRYFEGKQRHRYGDIDLVLDDAGH
jgi:hypothetical protein